MYKVAIDLDGTALNAPKLYDSLFGDWPAKVYALTARPTTEYLITRKHLEEAGLGKLFDEIIMFPIPYIYDNDTQTFWHDDGEIVFTDMDHRARKLRDLKEKGRTEELPAEHFGQQISLWKARMCLERGIKVMFEDSDFNVTEMLKHGIYVFKVDRGTKLD